MKLDSRQVTSLARPGLYWDDDVKGFGVQVHNSGLKTWVLKWRENGKQRWTSLGHFDKMTAEHAREAAARLLMQSKKLKPVSTVHITVKEFCRLYLSRHASSRKRTWKLDEGRCRLYLIPKFGEKRLDEVTRSDIAFLHVELGRRAPFQANRLKEQVSKMWKLAKLWGLLPENHPDITFGVADFQEEERSRYFTAEEVNRLAWSIDAEKNVYVRSAFWLLLLTGLRRNEVLRMKWSDIDFEINAIKLRGKNNQVTWQHLSAPALEVLSNVPRRLDNPHVICGALPGQPRNTVQKAWARIATRAQLKDARIHDIRRTVGSWLVQSGVELATIQKVLNHKTLKATMIYSRMAPADKARALEEYGAKVKRLTG